MKMIKVRSVQSTARIGKEHLMRCLAWNAMQITLVNESKEYAQQAAKGHFAVGMNLMGKTILKDVSKFKKEIAHLAATQKALKQALRTGKPNTKKHGMNDPRYTAFIQSCKD